MVDRESQLVWQEIRFFESHEALQQVAAQRLGFNMPAVQAYEILACLQLARDYYQISNGASITVKPLSLFYGMSNLVKALVLLCGGKERSRLAKAAQGHGLKLLVNGKNLEDVACRVGARGTFCSFADTFKCDIQFQFPGVFDGRLRSAGTSELCGQVFSLRALLGWFPALRVLYRQTFGIEQPIVRVEMSRNPTGGPYRLHFPDGLQGLDWVKSFPVGTSIGGEQHFVKDADVIREIETPALPTSGWLDWVEMRQGGIGWPFAVEVMVERDAIKTRHLAPWMAEYAAMFILSGVVRYVPAQWIGMVGQKSNSRVLALVEAFVSFAEVDFPTKVLDMFKRVTMVKESVTTLDELIVRSLG